MLRMHRVGVPPTPPGPGAYYGPTDGAAAIRSGAGPRPVSLPAFGTDITPGNLTQANINAIGVGGTIRIRAGIHRPGVSIGFLEGQTVYAEDGAVIKGSAVVTDHSAAGWIADGAGRWRRGGQTQDFSAQSAIILASSSNTANPVCNTELEDYYLDGVPMIAVTSSAAVTPGSNKKYMNRGGDEVWIGVNPANYLIERLVVNNHLVQTFNHSNFTLIGGVWEHALYRTVSMGSYQSHLLPQIHDIVVEDVEARYGHLGAFNCQADTSDGGTVPLMNGVYIRHNNFHHGGKYNHNIGGVNAPTIEYNEFAYGNILHFGARSVSPNDEGASKAFHWRNGLWQYNWSHHSDGPEWWDTDCAALVQESVFEDNECLGIMWEGNTVAGQNLTVYRNHFKNNGRTNPTFGEWGTGHQGNLYLSCSFPGDVSRNIFQSDAGVSLGSQQTDIKYSWQAPGRPETKEWFVHHNLFNRSYAAGDGYVSNRGGANQLMQAVNNNKFDFNEYHCAVGTNGRYFWPSGTYRTYPQWRAGDAAPSAPASYYDPNSTLAADL